ncbi:glycosyltransferase [Jejuia pallidilutea]|nr:glycosyltransferase [Jejuia pallidilutea]GAL67062.1 beta-1,3-glucosyltransferase [Jejuia pallidilutea]GAL70770.1 beta-1,3-glucosyltransferase [Jejuia pallidilutea]
MNPKISIIVPVYNAENFISKCIESILAQTYNNLEIILVNDGSTDNSLSVCNRFKELDSRIILINQKNEGTSSARNKGLKVATGEYIGFVDGDDFIDKKMYEILMSTILECNLKLAECNFVKSTSYESLNYDDLNIEIESVDQAISRIEKPGFYSVCTKIFYLDLLKNIQFVYGKVHQDALFVSEVYKKIEKVGYINLPLYTYTVDNESVTRTHYNYKKVEGIDVILETNKNLLKLTKHKDNKALLNKVLVNYLTYNYIELFNNPDLDKNLYYRKK